MATDNQPQDLITSALAELQRLESGVFQFGQRVRLFLRQLPAELPKPASVTPSVVKPLDSSYLHMLLRTPDEVAAWASWMGAPVERKEQSGAVFTSATGTVDRLPVYVGCMTLTSQSAEQAADTEGGGC